MRNVVDPMEKKNIQLVREDYTMYLYERVSAA